MSHPGSYVPINQFTRLPMPGQEQHPFWPGYPQAGVPGYSNYPWGYAAPNVFQPNPGMHPAFYGNPPISHPPRVPQSSPSIRPLFRVTFYAVTPPPQPFQPFPYQQHLPPTDIFNMRNNSLNPTQQKSTTPTTDEVTLSKTLEATSRCNSRSSEALQNQSTEPLTPISTHQLPDCPEIRDLNYESISVQESVRSVSQTPNSFQQMDEPLSMHQCNLNRVKNIMMAYLYEERFEADCLNLTPTETTIVKILLIKKLIQDKKISKLYYVIKNLDQENLVRFMQENPPINRKNIIKANIFKSLWKILETRYKGQMIDLFFSPLYHRYPKEHFSIKLYRKMHNSNLGDNFYRLCFQSERFCQEFAAILNDPAFGESIIQQSKQKFLLMFDSWTSELLLELQRNANVFDRHTKIPDFKFGTSVYELSLSTSLFEKIMTLEASLRGQN